MKTIQEIIKDNITGGIFTEFPTTSLLNDDNAFDVYVNSDDLADEYIICEAYEDLTVDEIREVMNEKYDDLISLQKEIFYSCTKIIQINNDEYRDAEDFFHLKNQTNALLHRGSTADEFVTFNTIRLGDM